MLATGPSQSTTLAAAVAWEDTTIGASPSEPLVWLVVNRIVVSGGVSSRRSTWVRRGAPGMARAGSVTVTAAVGVFDSTWISHDRIIGVGSPPPSTPR
jgi:hypothetical protein